MSSPAPVKSTMSVVSVEEMNVTSVLTGKNNRIVADHELTKDEAVIMALGYKAEFKREFSLLTTFGVSFSVLGLLPSVASTLWYSLAYGGTAGMTWGYLLGMIGVTAVACSMAEISSAFPTSGGLYYATAMLAPPKYKALFSWTVGWSNYIVQITGVSVGYSCASMILAVAEISGHSYVRKTWHTYLLTVAITFLCSTIASMPTKWLANVNSISASLNMIFFFISFVVVLAANTRESQGLPKFNHNNFAWGITNYTDWPDGICILMTFTAVIWMMSGFDSPFHLAEECSNAQVATPRAIVLTVSVGGMLGFIYQLVIAYTITDIDAVISDPSGQPYVAFLNQVLNRPTALALSSFAIILSFTMTSSCMIAASRVLFSYSRDNCFPLSRYWSHVNTITQTPVNAVWANWFMGQLLCLLMFGGVAINAIFSVGAIGSFISFTIPTLLRITYARNTFKPGPWNLGRFSIVSGTIAVCFVLLMIPILNFPQFRGKNNTPDLMNWTVLVYWGAMTLAISWFFIYGHKIYKGPRSNLDRKDLMDEAEAEKVLESASMSGQNVKLGVKDDVEK